MHSTVQTRPSHYDVLGLEPTASDDEIARAFARQISSFQPRAFGGIAEVSVAYETLRDPVRRRNYDESIGLKPEPKAPPPTNIAFTLHRKWTPGGFIIAPQEPAPEAAAPQATAADPLFEAAEPPEPELAAEPAPEPEATSIPERAVEELLSVHSRYAEPSSFNWKRPAIIIGSLFLGAALIGGFAGWKSVETIEPEQAAEAATVGRPAGPARPATAEPAIVPSAAERTSLDTPPAPIPAKPQRARQRPAAEPQSGVAADSISEDIQVLQASSAGGAAELEASDQAASTDASATMTLPNRTIARTLSRIGYACGEVASTAAVDAGAGVFKVTCTSGHSYRAAPVGGRYHFRRWAGR